MIGATKPIAPTTISSLVIVPNAPAQDAYRRGIHYFTGWRTPDPDYGDPNLSPSDAPRQYPWNDVQYFAYGPPRRPGLGFYNDGIQSVTDAQILAMVDAGYDYVIYQINWAHKKWDATGSGLTRGHTVANHMSSPYASKLKFTVMWHDVNSRMESTTPSVEARNYWLELGWSGSKVQEAYRALFTLWFRDYASNPNFDQYRGRPVVFIFAPENLRTPSLVLPGAPTAQGIISLLRTVAAEYGFSGTTNPFIVAQSVPDIYVDSLSNWGFNAHTGYVYRNPPSSQSNPPTGQNYSTADYLYRWKWNWALGKSSANLEYWVPNASGSDLRPWTGLNGYDWTATASNFETLVKASMDTSSARQNITGRNVVTCCWNEWAEGAYVEPSTMDYGYTYRGSALSDANRRTVLGHASGSNRIPEGWFDEIWADGHASGWALDPDTPNQPLHVHFYKNGSYPTGQFIGGALTDSFRGDINSAYGVEGTHGFWFQLPSGACNSYIYIHMIDTSGNDQNPQLGGAPRYYAC